MQQNLISQAIVKQGSNWKFTATLLLFFVWSSAPTFAQDNAHITICSHSVNVKDHRYNILGKNAKSVRDKLSNPINFGSDGTYGKYVFEYVEIGNNFTQQTLLAKKCNIFYSGFESDTDYTSTELEELRGWVNSHNGQVMAGCDTSDNDPVCDLLGYNVTTDKDTFGFMSGVSDNLLNCNGALSKNDKLSMSGGAGAYFSNANGIKPEYILAVHETGGVADKNKPIVIYTGHYFLTSDINMIQEGTIDKPTLSDGGGVTTKNDILVMNAFSALADASLGVKACSSVEKVSTHLSDGITRTPWQMNRGEGIIRATSPLKNTSDPAALKQSKIPKADAEGWKKPPTDAQGNISIDEKSKLGTCNTELDFTYFQTLVTVPVGTTLTDSKVTFSHIDDLAQIHIYNSINSHISDPIRGKNTHTSDLSKFIATGEVNRIVITQVDTCKVKNTIKNIQIKIAGNVVEVNDQVVSAVKAEEIGEISSSISPYTNISDLTLSYNGRFPLLKASCLKGDSIVLTGIHNIEGQLRFGDGESTFAHTCLNTRIDSSSGSPVLHAGCMNSQGELLESSIVLVGTPALIELSARHGCGTNRKVTLKEIPRGAEELSLPFNKPFDDKRSLDGTTCTVMFRYVATETYQHASFALAVDASRDKDTVDGAHPYLMVGAHANATSNLEPFATQSNLKGKQITAEDFYGAVMKECGAKDFRVVQVGTSSIGSMGFFGQEACYTGNDGKGYYVRYGIDRDTPTTSYMFKAVNLLDSSGNLCKEQSSQLVNLEQQCFDKVQGKVAWNQAGNTSWIRGNVQRLCAGTTTPNSRIACFKSEIAKHNDWEKGIMVCKD